MTIAAPEVFDAPKGDENSLDASANTLRNKVGAIGTTLSTYTERTTSAMDAMASVRAQQLFSYVGKATSMLQNAQERAGSAGTAIADYASELSEVKQELESLRNQWVDLAEDDKALSESYQVWAQRACVAEPEIEGTDGVTWDQLGAPPVVLSATGRDLGLPFTGKEYPVVGQLISMAQVDLELQEADQQLRMATASSGATEKLTAQYLDLDPLEVMTEAKKHELELIKARTGMTLADLGYDTPEEQLAWLTGEGAQMRERELRYSEYARGGFGQVTEKDLVDAGVLPQEALTDGFHTPGTLPGINTAEDWSQELEDLTLDGVVGDLRSQLPTLFGDGGTAFR